MVCLPPILSAQTDSVSRYMLMPLIFEKQRSVSDDAPTGATDTTGLKLDMDWLNNALRGHRRMDDNRYRLMIDNPDIVRFNERRLPKPPKEIVVETDPSATELEVDIEKIDGGKFKPIDRREIKNHNWLHTFVGSLHGTQALSLIHI